MGIRVLPEHVASQIAAGEVVERPASVVKELVENAIDAGAQNIHVEVQKGGKQLMRVTDDGCGVPADEVTLAFQRHSTSKLTTAADLSHITTLGFRGEALASIAAVSRVTFETCAVDEPVGTLLRLEGGHTLTKRESGRPSGTAVTVENLFFNVPARRKFLRTDRTERRHIDDWLTRYAMAYPGLRFTLSHNGRESFRSPGSGQLRDVLAAIYGLDVGEDALDILPQDDSADIRVSGLVGPPSFHRANRTYITLFVNGRWVKDNSLTYAVTQAYHTLLPKGRHPLAVVKIELPPNEVDVNVHPTKAEVRFRDGNAVFRAVQKAVRQTLLERAPVPRTRRDDERTTSAWPSAADPGTEQRRERLARLESSTEHQLHLEGGASETPGAEDGSIPPLRVIGQLGTTYIVAEGPEGMYLIDQHAAHERVLFEQLLAEREQADVPSQSLLEPALVELAPEASGVLAEHLEVMTSLGFEVEPFGGSTMMVRALPALVAEEEPAQVLDDVAAAILNHDDPLAHPVEEAVAREVCKQAAVKAGQTLSRQEIDSLLRSLEQSESPRTCPHGRPTMIHLSVDYLAGEFERR